VILEASVKVQALNAGRLFRMSANNVRSFRVQNSVYFIAVVLRLEWIRNLAEL
jgi:hypothetical protein